MKNLGQIQIGGSLDITTNKHVEDLIEEAIEGLDIPEDTNTTYTLTQDGLTIQLVDDGGTTVSEIELPEPEDTNTTYTLTNNGTTIQLVDDGGATSSIDLTPLIPQPVDPYGEVKVFTVPPANLFNMLSGGGYRVSDDFDMSSEFDAENNLISIYLHLYEKGIEKKFTLADNVSNLWPVLDSSGDTRREIYITDVSRSSGDIIITGTDADGADDKLTLSMGEVKTASESDLSGHDETVIYDVWGTNYLKFRDTDFRTESEPTVITGTLEEHLQTIYDTL